MTFSPKASTCTFALRISAPSLARRALELARLKELPPEPVADAVGGEVEFHLAIAVMDVEEEKLYGIVRDQVTDAYADCSDRQMV